MTPEEHEKVAQIIKELTAAIIDPNMADDGAIDVPAVMTEMEAAVTSIIAGFCITSTEHVKDKDPREFLMFTLKHIREMAIKSIKHIEEIKKEMK